MTKTLLISMLIACLIGCSGDSGDDAGTQTIFATPAIIEESNTKTQHQPLVPQADIIVPVIEPIIDEPDHIFDIFGPKLIESSIENHEKNVDIRLNTITLTFDEDVKESDIQIRNMFGKSLRWKRIINGKKVVLTPLGNVIDLKTDGQYEISGNVEDAEENKRTILIVFTTEKGDKIAPQMISWSVGHGDINVRKDTERFVFGFNENIDRADVNLWNKTRQIDMKWTMLIDGKRIILLRLPGEGLWLRQKERYRVQLRWADAARNWVPPDPGLIRIIDFETK